MKIIIEELPPDQEDTIIVRCRELDEQTLRIINMLKSGGKQQLTALQNGEIVMLDPKEVYYLEAVDNKVFIYTEKDVYETKQKLYEMEEQSTNYLRISKSVIINISKIRRLIPELSGRFVAQLKNNEKVVISRQYVPDLKEKLGL